MKAGWRHLCVVCSGLVSFGVVSLTFTTEFLKFVGPRGQKIMRPANNVSPHVRQTFLNDVFTFLTEVGSAGRIVNTEQVRSTRNS